MLVVVVVVVVIVVVVLFPVGVVAVAAPFETEV